MASFQPAMDPPGGGPLPPSGPVLIKGITGRPNFSTASPPMVFAKPPGGTSPASAAACPPPASISATRLASSASRRGPTTIFAPSAAKSLAVARPMPALAPVTMATLLCRRPMIFLLSGARRRVVELQPGASGQEVVGLLVQLGDQRLDAAAAQGRGKVRASCRQLADRSGEVDVADLPRRLVVVQRIVYRVLVPVRL